MLKTTAAPWSLNRRLIRATLTLIATFAMLLGVILAIQMKGLASRHLDAVGDALAAHLAEAVHQPLSDRDAISLQVAFDSVLAQNSSIGQVAVYSADGQLYAQKQREGQRSEASTVFTHPVALADGGAGSIRVALRTNAVTDGYLKPVATALTVWLVTVSGFVLWAARFGHDVTARLRHLCRGLPAIEDEVGDNELAVLEKRIAPLLINATPLAADAPTMASTASFDQTYTLAIHCCNLPRLRTHLNRESLERLLAGLDDLIALTLQLHDGHRLPGSSQCLFLRFSAAGVDADPALRALCCAHAIFALCREGAITDGVNRELVAVLGEFLRPPTGPQMLLDLIEGEHLHKLEDASTTAQPWQILLLKPADKQLEATGLVVSEPAPDNSEFALFGAFSAEQQALANQQVAYLRAHRH
ncbi:MAG: hypothetical protein ACSLE5_11870 [Porticoccaceae bacterium]